MKIPQLFQSLIHSTHSVTHPTLKAATPEQCEGGVPVAGAPVAVQGGAIHPAQAYRHEVLRLGEVANQRAESLKHRFSKLKFGPEHADLAAKIADTWRVCANRMEKLDQSVQLLDDVYGNVGNSASELGTTDVDHCRAQVAVATRELIRAFQELDSHIGEYEKSVDRTAGSLLIAAIGGTLSAVVAVVVVALCPPSLLAMIAIGGGVALAGGATTAGALWARLRPQVHAQAVREDIGELVRSSETMLKHSSAAAGELRSLVRASIEAAISEIAASPIAEINQQFNKDFDRDLREPRYPLAINGQTLISDVVDDVPIALGEQPDHCTESEKRDARDRISHAILAKLDDFATVKGQVDQKLAATLRVLCSQSIKNACVEAIFFCLESYFGAAPRTMAIVPGTRSIDISLEDGPDGTKRGRLFFQAKPRMGGPSDNQVELDPEAAAVSITLEFECRSGGIAIDKVDLDIAALLAQLGEPASLRSRHEFNLRTRIQTQPLPDAIA